ncbi:hypothetical protein RMSM_06275 [Rhodopirellula maiorica SM1]|uniref:Uncharacterized protein n=1 Tax=Rhodopirellula maiorica SM1 TaxID=1265738 RepID=M5RCN1_9BACT|nr:hypothetical protein RMSM_06275 [Rhodopirellula maiorica SM1]
MDELPRPLLIHLHNQSTYHDLSEQVLNFTTLSWRSTLPSEQQPFLFNRKLNRSEPSK